MTFSGRPDTYEEILFTSMREGGIGRKKDGWTGERFSDIYSSERLNADGSSRSKRSRGKAPKADPSAAKVQTFSGARSPSRGGQYGRPRRKPCI